MHKQEEEDEETQSECRHCPHVKYGMFQFKWPYSSGPRHCVYLAGSWWNWAVNMPMQWNPIDRAHTLTVELPMHQHHEFKFIVDEVWRVDKKQALCPNGQHDGYNNVMHTLDLADITAIGITEPEPV